MRANYGNMMPGMGQGNDPGFAKMMEQYQLFQRQFRGNPEQIMKQMLSSGQLSQQQFGQLQHMARQIMGLMPR